MLIHCKIVSGETILSVYAKTHTHRHSNTHNLQNYTKLNLQPTETGNKQGHEADEDSSAERKIWQVCCFGHRNIWKLEFIESSEGFVSYLFILLTILCTRRNRLDCFKFRENQMISILVPHLIFHHVTCLRRGGGGGGACVCVCVCVCVFVRVVLFLLLLLA